MKSDLEPGQFDGRLLPTVVAIIVAGLGALAWEWHTAHTSTIGSDPVMTSPSGGARHEARTAAGSPATPPSD